MANEQKTHDAAVQRNREAAAAAAEEGATDETVPGGRYMTADGRMVDANGMPLKEDSKSGKQE